jgi:hypothetical protein
MTRFHSPPTLPHFPKEAGSRRATRRRTRMGTSPNPRRDLPKDPRAGGDPLPRKVEASRDSDPPGSLVWVGLRPNRHRPHRETARTEVLSLTRRPSSRRKRRGRGWIFPRSLSRVVAQDESATIRRSGRAEERPKSFLRRLEPKLAALPFPTRRSGSETPGYRLSPGPGDGVERIDVHVKERFRRPFSSR